MFAKMNGRENVVEALASNDKHPVSNDQFSNGKNRMCADMKGDWVFYCHDIDSGFNRGEYSWYPCSLMDAQGSPDFPLGICTYCS